MPDKLAALLFAGERFCMKKFELGKVFITPGAVEELKKLGVNAIRLLGRHQGGDWSEMDIEDQKENEYSVDKNLRIFSSYTIKGYRLTESGRPCSTWEIDGVRFWVITEADRSATTILLPSEY